MFLFIVNAKTKGSPLGEPFVFVIKYILFVHNIVFLSILKLLNDYDDRN